MKKTIIITLAAMGIIGGLASMPSSTRMHFSKEDIRKVHHVLGRQNRTPIAPEEYFLHSFECSGCHGYDPAGIAMVNEAGEDVNLADDWSSSMMALSAVDPLWRAKVSHESMVNPGNALEAQTFCTGCHAPMGHYTAFFKGQAHYTIADLETDSLGLDGVSCSGCHMISDVNLGNQFSGNIPYDTNNVEYGPFTNPMTGPMDLYVGITPTYSEHVSQGRFCSPCHTLITNTLDLSGVPTGTTFVEQATFHEWVNSDFPAQNKTCQTCHMPPIPDPVIIAFGQLGLAPRSPFNLHTFAGANAFMTQIIKDNKAQLGVGVPDVNFDSSLAAINRVLRQQTVDFAIINTPYAAQDSLYIDVEIKNKAGHKFPSGYPSRRAVVQMIVTDSLGNPIFTNGTFDSDGELVGFTPPYYPHYNTINSESQFQIYEMIMGDVNGDRTTVLERAASHLKDNRIPPVGFNSTHNNYDTVKIVGDATTDPDFNLNGVTEGTGKDIVHYHIKLNGYTGRVNIYTRMYYQTLPPSWLNEMFTLNSAPIDSFRVMYNNADKSPILIGSDSIMAHVLNVGLQELEELNLTIFPNPSWTSMITLSGDIQAIESIEVYDLSGKKVAVNTGRNSNAIILDLPEKSGTYIIRLKTAKGWTTRKVVLL